MAQQPSKETNAAISVRHTNKWSRVAQEYRCVKYAEAQSYSVTDVNWDEKGEHWLDDIVENRDPEM